MVLRQIETELGPVAEKQPIQALELADALWDEGWLETRLLAAFLLGRIPPQEERLLARLTAWTQAVRDPSVRAALLTTSLTRLRKGNTRTVFDSGQGMAAPCAPTDVVERCAGTCSAHPIF